MQITGPYIGTSLGGEQEVSAVRARLRRSLTAEGRTSVDERIETARNERADRRGSHAIGALEITSSPLIRASLRRRGVLGLTQAVALPLDADHVLSILTTSAWWITRSMSAVAHAAFGKIVGHSLNARFVVRTRLFSLVASTDDLEEQVGVAVVEGEISWRSC